jgi:hypothetical protein
MVAQYLGDGCSPVQDRPHENDAEQAICCLAILKART